MRVLERAGSSLSLSGMGTTMTAAWVVDHHLVIAQVGDSRAYVLRRGELTQVTEDQSLVNHLLALGELAIEDVPTFKYSSVILQALGTSPGVYVALSTVDLVDGDRVLICSDGLSGMLSSGAIASVLGSGDTPEQMASALIKRANAAGGHDNITAIVIHFFGATSSAEVWNFRAFDTVLTSLWGDTTECPRDGLSIHSLLGGEQPRASTTAARRRAQRSSKGREGAKEHDVNASASSVWRAASTWLLLMEILSSLGLSGERVTGSRLVAFAKRLWHSSFVGASRRCGGSFMSNVTRVWAPLVTALCSLFVVGALGCSSDETTPAGTKPVATCSANEGLPDVKGKCVQTGIAPSNCAEGFIGVEGRDCEPVLPFDACPGGTMPVVGESTCQTVGVPDGKCGTGFESDGNGGCIAIFPASPCAKGTMAIPGESSCDQVSPCGSAPWGDIPVEASTQYVDASFAGTSDGSASKPWTTVQQAIDAAESGAIVVIADGSYVGSLMVKNKPVRLWGRCPASVESGSPSGSAALATVRASGTEIHALAMTGPGDAVAVQAATGVLLDHVWVHDTGYSAVYATGATHPISRATDSLIEKETSGGSVYIVGSSISIARTMMRQSASTPDGLASGPAIVDNNGSPGHLTLQQSAIDGASNT